MKKIILSIITIVLVSLNMYGQAPEAFKYQAVVRDAGNEIISDQSVGMRLTIKEGSASGLAVYTETFTVSSNAFGLVNLEIGKGTTTDDFTMIDWGSATYFIETAIDVSGGTTYAVMGTNQLMSVPYALYAKTSGRSIIDEVNDADSDPFNEIELPLATSGQTISWDGTSWIAQDFPIASNGWLTTGNSGTTAGTNFIGTIDNQALVFKMNNQNAGKIETNNTSFGYLSLNANTTGLYNNGNGTRALYHNTTGNGNTANGFNALFNNTTGDNNTANGRSALYSNTTGVWNTANGSQALNFNTSGSNNTANGFQALYSNTTGQFNTANGSRALYYNTTGNNNTANGLNSLYYNTTGHDNTANGFQVLNANTTGNNNTANGSNALSANTTGYNNTANGYGALHSNTTGNFNTATGSQALFNNTLGYYNTANGYGALFSNTTGNLNTAIGYQALNSNTSGIENTASGYQALNSNITGDFNTANGRSALFSNTTGTFNTANGFQALNSNTSGIGNTANGTQALYYNTTGDGNTSYGYQSQYENTTGYWNTTIGYYAGFLGTNLYNRVAIGYDSHNTASNQVRIGNNVVTSIGGFTSWSNVSDSRFKKDVNENVLGLDFVLKLRPVTYHLNMDAIAKNYKTPDSLRLKEAEALKAKVLQTGFIAQEVEATAQELGYEFSGVDAPKNENDFYGLRYAEFVVPLVKATQEQQVLIEALKKQNEIQQAQIQELNKLISNLIK